MRNANTESFFFIFSLFLSSTLLVSDFNRSAHLLSTFDLSHVAKDYLPLRTSTSALLTESTVVVSDHDQNLFFIDKSGASELRVITFLKIISFPIPESGLDSDFQQSGCTQAGHLVQSLPLGRQGTGLTVEYVLRQ